MEFKELLNRLVEVSEEINLTTLSAVEILELKKFFLDSYATVDDYWHRHIDGD